MIDTSQPLEAVHKETGEVVPMELNGDGRICGEKVFYTKKAPCLKTSNNTWHTDGRDYCHRKQWFIRNRGPLNWDKPLQTRNEPTSVTKLAVEGTLADGRRVIRLRRRLGPEIIYLVHSDGRVDGRDRASGDDIVNRFEPLQKTYQNIYADATISSTKHSTYEKCLQYSRYGGIRVGVLITETRGDTVMSARVHPTTPQLRSVTNPDGINPFA